MINSDAACCQFVAARRYHKERKEEANLRLICLFFVFTHPRMWSLRLDVRYIWNSQAKRRSLWIAIPSVL